MARVAAVFLVVLAFLSLSAPGAAGADARSRLYLLGGVEAFHTGWSVTPSDPEMGEGAKTFSCQASADRLTTWPCRTIWATSKTVYQAVGFPAGSRLEAPTRWSANEVTFHLELSVDSVAVPEVAVFVGDQTIHPATQVAPGVWEGRLTTAGLMDSRTNSAIFVGVRSASGFAGMTIELAGASWFDFPEPIDALSGPQVVGASTYEPSPSRFQSAERTWRFNDRQWEVRPFTGTHDVTKTLAVPLDRQASVVQVYVEGFSEPLGFAPTSSNAHGVSFTDQPTVSLVRPDGTVMTGGQRAAAAAEVPAGQYTVEVRPHSLWTTTTGRPPAPVEYDGYVVIIYGDRTLAGTTFSFPLSAPAALNTPVARSSPIPSEDVAVPERATSLRPVLTAERLVALGNSWAMNYAMSQRTGTLWSRQRLFTHGHDTLVIGTTPTQEHQVASQDVRFTLEVSYTYGPLP